MVEKMILNQRVHLGFVRDTFNAGAVLEVDEDNGLLTVDGGRKFTEVRDIPILKRAGMVLPFSEETHAAFTGRPVPPFPEQIAPGKKPGQNMQVVQSDADLTEEFDISETQVAKRREEAQEAAKAKVATEGMPIIQGDESIEEVQTRQAAEGTAPAQVSEVDQGVEVDGEGQVRGIPVVSDDDYGYEGGSAASALNAGQNLLSREEVEANTGTAKAIAESRRGEADKARAEGQRTGSIPPLPDAPAETPQEAASDAPVEDSRDATIASLQESNQKLSGQVEELMASLKAKVKPRKTAKKKAAKKTTKVVRRAVTNPNITAEVAAAAGEAK